MTSISWLDFDGESNRDPTQEFFSRIVITAG